MSVVWRSSVQGEEKLVLLAIADHADPEGGNAWPTLETLATYASVSVRTVQRIVRRLVDAGLVTVERNRGGTVVQAANRRPNLYELDLEAVAARGVTGVTPTDTPAWGDRGDKTASRGDRSASRGDSPKPSPAETLEEHPSEHPSEQTPSSSRPEVEELCTLLADLVEANGSKRPTVSKAWRDAARLMLDKDGRDPVKAAELIRWTQADDFWRGNVMSMPKFRARYDQLRLKAVAEWRTKRSTADKRVADAAGLHDRMAELDAADQQRALTGRRRGGQQLAIGGGR